MELQYKAKTQSGTIQTGVLVVESKQDARARLKKQGLFPLQLEPASGQSASSKPSAGFSRRGIGKHDVLMLTCQLSIICQAGLDIAEAIEIVSEECPNPSLRTILDQIHADIENGVSVSEALRTHSEIFGEAYVAAIAAGEASGTLPDVLERLAELLEHEIQLTSSVRSVLAYPAVLIGVLCVVLAALVFFVLPQFSSVFESLGKTPPVITRLLIDASSFLRSNVVWLAVAFGILLVGLRRGMKTGFAARHWDRFVLHSRLVRKPTRALMTGRAFRLLGTMLQSGIPLLDGIRLCRASVRNHIFRDLFDRMDNSVVGGGSIGGILKESNLLPPGVSQMVGAAERTGQLGPVMVTVGKHFEVDGEKRLREMAKLLEPCVVVVMGVIVSGVVMSVMLPLLDITSTQN
jgi:type II secretory pathway component PulF